MDRLDALNVAARTRALEDPARQALELLSHSRALLAGNEQSGMLERPAASATADLAGQVWLAQLTGRGFEGAVVVKLLNVSVHAGLQERFRRE